MNRIMIIGCSGAGKSTLALQLHAITGIEIIHLDQHYWQPNWVELPKEKWVKRIKQFVQKEQWIMDGNYGGTMEIRFDKAEVIVFLDRSKWLCLYRVVKRVISHYGKTRQDMGAGCPERFSWEFLKYVYHYNQTRRPKLLVRLSALSTSKEIVILSKNREVKTYLAKIKNQSR